MKDKQKIHFPQRKCSSHWFWIFGWHRVRFFWFGLAWLCTKASPVARCGYRPVRQHRAGLREEGGRSERGKHTDPSLFSAMIGSGRVYCRKREVGRQERRGGVRMRAGVGWGAARCLSYRIVWLSLCLFVCLSSHCRNQFALCGTVDKERERLPGGLAQEKQQQTQPGHMKRQKPRLTSNMRNKPQSKMST